MFVKLVLFLIVAFIVRTLLSFYKRLKSSPHRPTLTNFLDALVEIFAALKVGPWSQPCDIHTAMKRAIKETGLSDIGTTTNFEFLKRYDTSRNIGTEKSKAVISPAGAYFMGENLTKRFKNRLYFVDYLKKHPSILKIEVKSPVFVIGFPRTGTTFLHEILGLHEDVRMHYTWEQMAPVPTTHDEGRAALNADRVKRYNDNKGQFEMLFKYLIGQEIQHIHRIGYDEPEECTIPCAFELPWALSEIPFNVFAAKELFPMGAGDAFVYYRKFLQMMTWQSEDRAGQDFTWLLKCPFHLPYLEDLHKEFPGATVVWTHRDPAECIASACSLYETIMRMACEESSLDAKALGRAVMNYTKLSLEKAEATFKKLGKGLKVIHIRYIDNVKNTKAVCKNVLEQVLSFLVLCFCVLIHYFLRLVWPILLLTRRSWSCIWRALLRKEREPREPRTLLVQCTTTSLKTTA